MEERSSSYGRTYWWTVAVFSGVGGTIMLGFLILLLGDDLFRTGVLILVVALMYFMFGFSLYGIYKSADEASWDPSVGPYVCKHCGRRFPEKKVWEMHERTCVEMKM